MSVSLSVLDRAGHVAAVELLLDRGAKAGATDAVQRTALTFATERGHTEVVRLLLDHGGSVEAPSSQALTPIALAAAPMGWRV